MHASWERAHRFDSLATPSFSPLVPLWSLGDGKHTANHGNCGKLGRQEKGLMLTHLRF